MRISRVLSSPSLTELSPFVRVPVLPSVLIALALCAVSLKAGDLPAQVDALPVSTGPERLKKAVLVAALEQSRTLPVAESEVRSALAAAPESFGAPGAAGHLMVLRPPRSVEENPYFARLVAGAKNALSRPDAVWPRAVSGGTLFAGLDDPEYDPRRTAARMEAYLWLFANPASPLKGDSEVLARFLRRAHTYVSAILTEENKAGKNIYDDFALVPAATALREFASLYPSLLLPSQRAAWARAMRVAGYKVMEHSDRQLKEHPRGYANIDAAISIELLNFGLALNDHAMLARSREMMSRVADDLLPDGGFHYIWNQNESSGYHDVVCQFIARAYEITGEEQYLEMLRRAEWYGPVSNGRLSEYWTAPSWKHTWNSALKGIVGGEFVVGATGNPYVNGMQIRPDPSNLRNWEYSRPELPWFQSGLGSKALPDEVTYPDRNIDGPRAWYGRFSYAATLRDLPVDEPGHATLMGALTTTAEHQIQAFLMGVYPRVRLGDDPGNPRSWAWLTSGMTSSRVVARHLSVFRASYELVTFNSARVGTASGWRAEQVWLGLSDRIIGQIKVIRGPEAKPALDVQGIVRLGTGGTVNGVPQTLREIGPDTWQYGEFVVRIWQQTFATVEPVVVPFRLPKFPVTEITLKATLPTDGASFLVEIRPSWSEPAVQVAALPDGMEGFQVALGAKHFTVFSNPSSSAIPLTLAAPTLFVSGREKPLKPAPASFELPAGGCAVILDSPETRDHEAGVQSFRDLVSQ